MEKETSGNTGENRVGLTDNAKKELRSASGWVKAFAIIGFIGGGFMVLASFGLFFVSFILGLLYLIIAGVAIYMAVLLLRQATALSKSEMDMDTFSSAYFMYWKVAIILTIVSFVLGIISSFVLNSQASSLQNLTS